MKKLKQAAKKLISAIVALALFISPLSDYLPILGEGMKVSAASITESGVWQKIEELRKLFPNGSYFTVNDKTCGMANEEQRKKHSCKNCLLSNILANNTKAKNTNVANILNASDQNCYTCVAFAKFAYCYIFGHRSNEKDSNNTTISSSSYGGVNSTFVSQLKPGDYLCFFKGDNFVHAAIYLGCNQNKNQIYVYENNYGESSYSELSKVLYNNSKDCSKYSKITAIRSKTYSETLDLTTTPLNLGDQFLAAIQSSDGTKALTVDSNNNVSIQKYVGTPNQTWMFTRTDGNYYEIKNPATGKCLDAANGGNSDYTNIQVWEDNDTSSQRYGIYGSQNSYVMRVKYSSVLVVDAGAARNNVNLYTYSPNIAAQKFRIFCLFDNVSVTNITSTNALVAAKFHKPSEAKALAYDISVSTSSNMQNAVTHSCKPSSTNVGNTSRDITFDFVKEYNHYLSANTTYYYRLIGKYDINGSTVTYTSPVYSFKTLADSTDPSVTVKASTSRYKNTITNTNAIIYGEVDKPSSYPVTKIGIRVRVDGGTYDSGWSRYDGTSSTYVGSTFMCPYYDMNKELKLTLTHSTKYFYKFYAVVNGKEYWSPEGSFTTTGSHSFGPWITTKPATCTESGVQTRSCSCGKTETQTIPATGHSYGAWTTTKAPTCTESGIQTTYSPPAPLTAVNLIIAPYAEQKLI